MWKKDTKTGTRLTEFDIEEKKTCGNCGASYEVKHDLPEEDYIERFCPFCGEEKENDDEISHVEDRYEDCN